MKQDKLIKKIELARKIVLKEDKKMLEKLAKEKGEKGE